MNSRQQFGNRGAKGDMGAGQSGVMLLEALIAILIFSLGILTVIGLQASSIKMAADAQLRTRASLLADYLIGQMWVSGYKIGDMKTAFESPDGDKYKDWRDNKVKLDPAENPNGLPGIAGDGQDTDCTTSTQPTVTITDSPGTAAHGLVDITLCWRTPSMESTAPGHRYRVVSQITRNP
jgi:type IV pilus assembly protein PilV